MKALQIHAGAMALKQLRERALQPADMRILPAAAGGPKGAERRAAFGLRLQFAPRQTHKDGKGSMVMTPRTTGFVTET